MSLARDSTAYIVSLGSDASNAKKSDETKTSKCIRRCLMAPSGFLRKRLDEALTRVLAPSRRGSKSPTWVSGSYIAEKVFSLPRISVISSCFVMTNAMASAKFDHSISSDPQRTTALLAKASS